MNIDDDKLEDINDMGEEDNLLINIDIASQVKYGNHFGAYHDENQ